MHLSWHCFCNINPIHELLAVEGERKRTEHLDLAGAQTHKPKALETLSPEGKKKSKGIMKFLGRSFFNVFVNMLTISCTGYEDINSYAHA